MSRDSNPDYYDNEELWGGYQFLTLDKIVNDFIYSLDDDDYISNVKRDKVVFHSKRAIRELFTGAMRQIRAVQLTIGDKLTIQVPQDYINYVRISWVDEEGLLHPLALNNNISMAKRYLQDHKANILLDSDGYELFDDNLVRGSGTYTKYTVCCNPFQPNRDYSENYSNGSYNVDTSAGVIRFSSDVESKEIVLEYISDGLFMETDRQSEKDIKIHKFADTTIRSYVYYELIKFKRNVPAYAIKSARDEYFNDLRLLKRKINTIRMSELLQAFKSANKWIKK